MAKDSSSSKKGNASRVHKPEKPRSGGPSFTQRISAHPVRWAVIAYALLAIIFFSNLIFFFDRMAYGTDTMSSGVFFRTFHAEFWRSHLRTPLWDPYIHAGLPFVDAMHGDIFYPAALLQIIFPVTYALGLKLILHVFLAGVFMFLFLRALGRSDQSSFIGGLLYMFMPCLVSLFYPGHDGKIYVTALTPLAFLLVHKGVSTRRLGYFFWFGLVYALMILTAHVQMSYYAAWGLGAYFIFLLWDQHRFKLSRIAAPVGAFALAVLLAAGTSSIQWMAPYQYLAKYSQRIQHSEGGGYDWASSWAMHSEELLAEINPPLPGADLAQEPATYWGTNYFKLNSEAVGVMAVILAAVALIAASSPSMWFFAGLSLLALLHALGDSTPVFRLFFEFVPGVKKFRAPSMICFLFGLSWIVMATRSIDILGQFRGGGGPPSQPKKARDPYKVLMIVAVVYSVIAVIGLIAGSSFMSGWASFTGDTMTKEKAQAIANNVPYMRIGFLLGLIVVWGTVGLLRLRRAGGLGTASLVGCLSLLAVLPLWQFDSRFVTSVTSQQLKQFYGDKPILGLIHQNSPDQPYRVLNLPRSLEDNYLALHEIEELSPTAMHGNHLLTHDNFVGRHDASPALLTNDATRNLLNAIFLVSSQPFTQPGMTQVGQAGGLYLYKNEDALPRAAVFYQYEVDPDSNRTLEKIRSSWFPYRSRLILDQAVSMLPPSDSGAAPIAITPARVLDWDVDRFAVECDAERDGLLWLSENYYPAWSATDENGQNLPIYRADYTFRAVAVKAGKHRIAFEFHNKTFTLSMWLSFVSLLMLVGGGVLALRRKRTPA